MTRSKDMNMAMPLATQIVSKRVKYEVAPRSCHGVLWAEWCGRWAQFWLPANDIPSHMFLSTTVYFLTINDISVW